MVYGVESELISLMLYGTVRQACVHLRKTTKHQRHEE